MVDSRGKRKTCAPPPDPFAVGRFRAPHRRALDLQPSTNAKRVAVDLAAFFRQSSITCSNCGKMRSAICVASRCGVLCPPAFQLWLLTWP
jgi:hypothetical protein